MWSAGHTPCRAASYPAACRLIPDGGSAVPLLLHGSCWSTLPQALHALPYPPLLLPPSPDRRESDDAGAAATLKVLAAWGADLKAKDDRGKTPFEVSEATARGCPGAMHLRARRCCCYCYFARLCVRVFECVCLHA